MTKNAWFRMSAFACCTVVATACVVSTNDSTDPPIENIGGADGTGGSHSGGSSSSGGTTGDAGAASEIGGAAGGTSTGTCTTPMDSACAACLSDTANGFSTADSTGVWDKCDGQYPCCEESARYVACMQIAWEDGSTYCEDQGWGDDYAGCCEGTVAFGLVVDPMALSEEFRGVDGDAFTTEVDPNCYTECFLQ